MAKDVSRRWVKVWHEILTDQDFQNLSLEQQACFYNLLIYTSAHGDKGSLKITPPARAILHLLHCADYESLKKKIGNLAPLKNLKYKAFCNGEITVTFLKWHKYQIDDSSGRVSKFRQNVTVQDKEKEEDKEEDRPNPDVKIFINYAFEQFRNKTGEKLCVDGKKDGAIVKKLLGTYSLERLKGLWDVFMQSDDSFIRTAGYSIGVFKSQINKLLLKTPPSVQPQTKPPCKQCGSTKYTAFMGDRCFECWQKGNDETKTVAL